MPIYEYKCPKCKLVFEEIVKLNIDEYKCPKCKCMSPKIISRCSFKVIGGTDGGINAPPIENEGPRTITRIPRMKDPVTGKEFLGKPESRIVNK